MIIPQTQFSRSDAQRSVKQKERKKQELERQVFSGDHFSEEGGFPSSLVSPYYLIISYGGIILYYVAVSKYDINKINVLRNKHYSIK